MALKKRQKLILQALQDLGGKATTRQIAEKTGLNVNGVAQSLGALSSEVIWDGDCWELLNKAHQGQILQALKDLGGSATTREIAVKVKLPEVEVVKNLNVLDQLVWADLDNSDDEEITSETKWNLQPHVLAGTRTAS